MKKGEFKQWAMIYAMQGLLANPVTCNPSIGCSQIAAWSRQFADALVEAEAKDEKLEAPNEPTN